MHRKIYLAIALVLGSSGSVLAQSSVTLVGVLDARVARGTGSVASRTQLTNNGIGASRLGFRGVEDLGGGLSASFWLEGTVFNDNGTGAGTNTNNQLSGAAPAASGGQGLTFDRRSTVSVAGSWGEIRLGRDYTPQFWNLTVFDPFTTLGPGSNQMYLSSITGPTTVRSSNGVGYFLPSNLGGFYGQIQHYLGENARNGAATEKDGTGTGVRLGYANGPFNVAVGMGRTRYSLGDVRQDNIGAHWDFKVAKIMGVYSRDRSGPIAATGSLFGVLVPVATGEVRASLSRYRTDAVGQPSTRKLALGYVHDLSKRTALYVNFARVANGGGASFALNGAMTAPNASSAGYDVGMRHNF